MTPAATARGVVVIGIGNRWGSDDAAGLLAAARVRDLVPEGIEVTELEGEPISLIDAWDGARAALVVDAVSSGSEPGTLHRVDAHADPLPRPLSTPSTHALGLAEAIEMGRALDRLPPRLVVYGIEGERFDAGLGVTDAVGAAIERAATAVVAELGREAEG